MELAHSPMSSRQRNYRQIYRERIASWYNGYLHIAIIYLIGCSVLFIRASHMQAVLWWEWFTVPVVLVACNFFE